MFCHRASGRLDCGDIRNLRDIEHRRYAWQNIFAKCRRRREYMREFTCAYHRKKLRGDVFGGFYSEAWNPVCNKVLQQITVIAGNFDHPAFAIQIEPRNHRF